MIYKGYEISARVNIDDNGNISSDIEELILDVGDESYDEYHYYGCDELNEIKKYCDELDRIKTYVDGKYKDEVE